jgi:hypothetical protein
MFIYRGIEVLAIRLVVIEVLKLRSYSLVRYRVYLYY